MDDISHNLLATYYSGSPTLEMRARPIPRVFFVMASAVPRIPRSALRTSYGQGGGANVIVESKSGTAQLQGNAYYFGRNEPLNANNFFANATGVARGEFRRHQPGGTLGGPVQWSGKRAFFFVSYQATRDVNAASLASSVRSLSLPPGGVKIAPDGSNINPAAVNLLNARNPDGSLVIPSPQTAGGGVNYTALLQHEYGCKPDKGRSVIDEILLREHESEPAVLRGLRPRIPGAS
jgi:hypothetical protein